MLTLALAGCGGVGSGSLSTIGSQLTVYSSLPLQGSSAAISQQIVDGEKLALARSKGRIGPFKISYVSLDDAEPANGQQSPGKAETNARIAAQDASTIAYLGDYDSDDTAVSLPLINAAGILQVSPGSPYIGLTSSLDAGQDEPERFYPSAKRTFGSLIPGDSIQARAQVQMMRARGVHRLYVLSDENPFHVPLAEILAADARAAGIEVLASDTVNIKNGTNFASVAQRITEAQAQAVFFSGSPTTGTVELWRALYEADKGLRLYGSSALVNSSFTSQIGPAAQNTLLGTPVLPAAQYPPAAQRLLRAFRLQFGYQPQAYALYGYEAMSVVLWAIRAAGTNGNSRAAVISKFFSIRGRESVLGRYSVAASGQISLTRYGFDRVLGGQPVFYRALEVS
ncbi:MAG TPA: branched-chain amino acid ABC transporter substrate-binding protein [Solirubrobacteraceae bacterium]